MKLNDRQKDDALRYAERLASESDERTVTDAIEKTGKFRNNPTIKKIWDNVQILIEIIKSPLFQRTVTFGAVAAILYLVSPIDIIPDVILGIGLIDDAFILSTMLAGVVSNIKKDPLKAAEFIDSLPPHLKTAASKLFGLTAGAFAGYKAGEVAGEYLLQGILGLGITVIAALIVKDLFAAAGVILPFGFGQGTGQALNYGNIYEQEYGFVGGRSFGLTIAALGFLSASIGGVIHLNILRRKGMKYDWCREDEHGEALSLQEIQGKDEIPMNGSIDKLTMQLVLICLGYLMAYGMMAILGNLVGSLKSILFGFNFLLGVIAAALIKGINNFLMKKKIVRRQHISAFLMTRLSGFFFDVMIVAGVAAIRINVLSNYWPIIIVLGLVGAFSTYFYTYYTAKTLFPAYAQEQFMVTYGMLTGTASTGIVLLRELDPDFRTPASENLVYQNFPAMVFGFPMMLLAAVAPVKPIMTLLIMVGFFAAMNLILFRSKIFKKKNKS